MKLSFFILTVIISLVVLSATPAVAAIYRYIDKDGLEHITNDFNQIPEEYREQFYDKSEPEMSDAEMKARAELEASTPSAMARRAQEEAEALEDTKPQTILQMIISFAQRHHALLALQIIAAVAAIVGLFLIGGRLSDAFGHKKLTMLIIMAISAIVIIYLVRSNVQYVSNSFNDITGKVDTLEKKLNARQKNINKRMEEAGERVDHDEEPGQRRFLENYPGASQ